MNQEPIAVVGLGAVLPGAFTLDQFWHNLANKVDCTQAVPPGRWTMGPGAAQAQPAGYDQVLSARGCFVPAFELDPTGLDLDWESLGQLDPLYSMALQAARTAWLEQKWERVDRSKVGVILAAIALPTDGSSAVTWNRYRPLLRERLRRLRPDWKLGGDEPEFGDAASDKTNIQVTGLPASLVARGLGLGGGSYTLDAACASSLYSLKLACDELRAGRAEAMLAGGVSRPDCLYTQMGFTALGALSGSGRCSPFDVKGDGLVVGEGAGVLVLKRLSTALDHGDEIHGLIRGIGLSNDIGGSLLAPNVDGQLRAMRSSYGQVGWNPEDVQLIECHGTGTPMGDRIEVTSLCTLWENRPWSVAQCGIGSVKSGIGHLLTGAGAAGMMKVLLGMRHQQLPPSLNFNQPDPTIPLPGSPFRVVTQLEAWDTPSDTRKAAVSAFGFGGINAHVLVEEFVPRRHSWPVPDPPPAAQPIAIVGLAVHIGSCDDTHQWISSIFAGQTLVGPAPAQRWNGEGQLPLGAFLSSYEMEIGGYKLPPRDVTSVLPQQTLMLKVAAQAARDANLSGQERQERAGAVIGISLDMDTTDFHLRWALPGALDEWAAQAGVSLSTAERTELLEKLRNQAAPPLDATRTLGALGSIVASRIARELSLGGPSFAVSAQEASGNKALEIACRALQQGEMDTALVGAIDLAGDPRVLDEALRPLAGDQVTKPFQPDSPGVTPGEGAVALVLKRLSDCQPGEKVYAVIHGLGSSTGGGIEVAQPSLEGQGTAVLRAHQEARWHPQQISLVEATGCGVPQLDLGELAVLKAWYGEGQIPCALGALPQHSGLTNACSGLLSVAKTALCLHYTQLPPLPDFLEPVGPLQDSRLHVPRLTSYWLRDAQLGPRRAAVHTAASDGNSSHIVLQEPPQPQPFPAQPPAGIFCLSGASTADLLAQGEQLRVLASRTRGLHQLAARWAQGRSSTGSSRAAIVAPDFESLLQSLTSLPTLLTGPCPGHGGVFYTPDPLRSGEVAFVFPGSGNHYAGMGRELSCIFPKLVERIDEESDALASYTQAPWTVPYRSSWHPGWEEEASHAIASDLHRAIFGQVMLLSTLSSDILRSLGVEPQAAIGYSLGESASLIALRAWTDRREIFERMESSSLFREDLGGPCLACRKTFGIAPDNVNWSWATVLLAHPVGVVRPLLEKYPDAELMIVNSDSECVVGGGRRTLQAVADELGGKAWFLEGVPAVHCRVVEPVKEAYYDLHLLTTEAPPGLRFYSAYRGDSYIPTRERAATAIVEQAIYGLDFPKVVRQAYADGVRFFVEVGPGRSCSRMISQILKGRPHLTRAINARNESEYFGLLKLLGQLYSEHVPGLEIARLYEGVLRPEAPAHKAGVKVTLGSLLPPALEGPVPQVPDFGGKETLPQARVSLEPVAPIAAPLELAQPALEPETVQAQVERAAAPAQSLVRSSTFEGWSEDHALENWSFDLEFDVEVVDDWGWPDLTVDDEGDFIVSSSQNGAPRSGGGAQIPVQIIRTVQATAAAHETYLRVAQQGVEELARAVALQGEMLQRAMGGAPLELPEAPGDSHPSAPGAYYNPFNDHNLTPIVPEKRPCLLDYDQCMEFAIGSVANVLGPEFAAADTYPTRVRLPDDPLMLVHRITKLEGVSRSLSHGRIITEHDVQEGAWYLDNQRMPVCVAVEAGQADLFLSGYLGIDLHTKGIQVYRLLDATVTFHRRLPTVGETIVYDIRIDRFVHQGDTFLFFFEFEGSINGEPVITMRKGCAGFFTHEAVRANKGIILTAQEKERIPGKISGGYRPLVSFEGKESYSEAQLDALRRCDLAGCFGPLFANLPLVNPPRLPSGRLKLYDRILEVDPKGGRFGLGLVRAEADIHPDDWFLTCHFVDDMVMPGTLMFECCAHTLRFLLWRMGWVGESDQVTYEPIIGVPSTLRCRGPVDRTTSKVIYEVELKEIGYGPTPYVVADAAMYANGKAIVHFADISASLEGLDKATLERTWGSRPVASSGNGSSKPAVSKVYRAPLHRADTGITYDQQSIYEFAQGMPSLAFGTPYRVFDGNDRRLARLPRAPFSFVDRIVELNQEPFVMQAGDWMEAQYDVPPGEWYFGANRQSTMPFAVLLEIALQPCGWLAAYVGSGLRSEQNLRFRNLGGKAILHREVFSSGGTLAIRVRMAQVSEAGGMIIENFEMQVLDDQGMVYEGTTYFGFFTETALATQVGIREAQRYQPTAAELKRARRVALPRLHPLTPDDSAYDVGTSACMPGGAMQMLDEVDIYIPDGGAKGLGYLHGSKKVNPEEWFFQAHFYLDPVWPGSLGLEAFMQLLKVAALDKFPQLADTHRFECIATGMEHSWGYRGQVVPKNQRVEVEAYVTAVIDGDEPVIKADGFLVVDGKPIYNMQDFAIRLVR